MLKISISSVLISLVVTSLPLKAETSEVGMHLQPMTFLDAIKYGKSLNSIRTRFEQVNQTGFQGGDINAARLKNAYAFTNRTLIGWQTAPYHHLSVATQITDVHEFNDQFNDRRNNLPEHSNGTANSSVYKRQFPNIVDPGFTDINQLFVDWTAISNTKVRAGRQAINLDNVRFIGDIAFRQNMQVFDGLSLFNTSVPSTEIYVAHFDKVRQVNTKLRDGNIDIINTKYRLTPTTTLSGYAYFIGVDNLSQNNGNPLAAGIVAQGGNGLGLNNDLFGNATTDASNKTLGVRFDGSHPINSSCNALFTAEFAKQAAYQRGSDLIDAHYLKAGGGLAYKSWSLRLDYEKLGSKNSKYAFQTPLGTNHLFQGWTDHFLVTPRQGIEDVFISAAGKFDQFKLYAEYHLLKADEKFQTLNGGLADKYGTEFDASITYSFSRSFWTKLEYAKFNEAELYGSTLQNAARKGDKEIVWLTAQYSF
jgi:hypothetical protein